MDGTGLLGRQVQSFHYGCMLFRFRGTGQGVPGKLDAPLLAQILEADHRSHLAGDRFVLL